MTEDDVRRIIREELVTLCRRAVEWEDDVRIVTPLLALLEAAQS